jgi:hypothetical protein
MTLLTLQENVSIDTTFQSCQFIQDTLTGTTFLINLVVSVGSKNVRKSGKLLRTGNRHGHFYYMLRILIRTYNEKCFDVFLFVIV